MMIYRLMKLSKSFAVVPVATAKLALGEGVKEGENQLSIDNKQLMNS